MSLVGWDTVGPSSGRSLSRSVSTPGACWRRLTHRLYLFSHPPFSDFSTQISFHHFRGQRLTTGYTWLILLTRRFRISSATGVDSSLVRLFIFYFHDDTLGQLSPRPYFLHLGRFKETVLLAVESPRRSRDFLHDLFTTYLGSEEIQNHHSRIPGPPWRDCCSTVRSFRRMLRLP